MAPALRTKLGCNKFGWDAAYLFLFNRFLEGGHYVKRRN